MKELSEVDKAWLAALIDGEGCIGIGKDWSSYRVYVEVYNTYIPLLASIIDRTGFGYINIRKKWGPNNKKPMGMYSITNRSAHELIEQVLPYLIAKKEQAKIALAFRDTVFAYNPQPRGKKGKGSVKLPPEILARRKQLHDLMVKANGGMIVI